MTVKVRKITAADLYNLSSANPETYKNAKRQIRKPIMAALDIYRTNVVYGDETETLDEKQEIIAYRQGLKDLDEEALVCVPEKIKYYMEK